MLSWNKLLCPKRRKELHEPPESMNTGIGRQEIERDYDRILFAAPTRRMANKTQVFPLEENGSIRTRLTHSHEVSNLARSIGLRLAFDHADTVFGKNHEALNVKRNVPAMLAAVGLAHDLGNPPFGHQGEVAIRQWLKVNKCDAIDLCEFDGNAQTFRLLTRLQVLNDDFGLNLTMGTLAGLLKYPSFHDSIDKGGYKKFGIFDSEKHVIEEVWAHTGLSEGTRHPLAFIMEACDDIAYSVIDAEDIVKKGYASFYDLMDFLEREADDDPAIREVRKKVGAQNKEFKKIGLSSRELNDISMQMFRVKAISQMVEAATETFVNNIDKILAQQIPPGYELIKNSACSKLCETLKKFDKRYGFQHNDVLKLELEGNNYIQGMMDLLWKGIDGESDSQETFRQYAFGTISENYRRVYEASPKEKYDKYQLIIDTISGMTETYLMSKYDELKSYDHAFV